MTLCRNTARTFSGACPRRSAPRSDQLCPMSDEFGVETPKTVTLELYRGDINPPVPGFRAVCSFVDDIADAQIAADTAILRQGGTGPIYRCRVTIPLDLLCDARVDLAPLLSVVGSPGPGETLFNHVHGKKQHLIDAGFTWVAFPYENNWVEYIYLRGNQALAGAEVPYAEVRLARRSPPSGRHALN